MNLKTCFAVFFIGIGLFSCSEDHVGGEDLEQKIVYDATLSLVLKQNASVETKANATSNKSYNFVKTLSVAVFQNDRLVAFQEKTDADKGVYGLEEIKVPAGTVKVIVLANTELSNDLRKIGPSDATPISAYENKVSDLMKEISGSLSMSSGFLSYDLRAGHNYIGYDKQKGIISVDHNGSPVSGVELEGKPIQLTRNVARVFLYNVKVRPVKSEFIGKGKVYFELKEIFLADVKSHSKSIWKQENGTIVTEALQGDVDLKEGEKFWWSGGAITTVPDDTDKKSFLRYDYINHPETIDDYNNLYFFVNGRWDTAFNNDIPGSKEGEMKISNSEAEQIGAGGGLPIGVDFFVYENTDETKPTKLILKGDYIYCPNEAGKYETIKDTYYTVIINQKGESTTYTGDEPTGIIDVPRYVRHNTEYIIYATILGPGSNKPLESHISAAVTVKNWDIVNQEEEVD